MRTDKELGAVRIMESLSGISEELLERCERAGNAAEPKKGKTHRYVYRYALACAACLCLIVAGTAYYSLSHIRMGGSGNASPKLSDGTTGSGLMNGGTSPMDEAEVMEMAPAEDMLADEGQGSVNQAEGLCGNVESDTEPEWLDVSSLAVLPGNLEEGAPGKENENLFSVDSDAVQEAVDLMKAAIRAEAARVPEGYSLVQADSRETVRESEKAEGMGSVLMYRWSNGECSLWLKITQTSLTADMRFDAKPPVYSVQEGWQELIPDAGADGYIQFALLYEDGALVEYCGCLDSEETIILMESLAAQSPVR